MTNESLDKFIRATGRDPDEMRKRIARKIEEQEEQREREFQEREKERLDFEDSNTPQYTTFLIRVPRISEKASHDPAKRKAVLPEARKAVKLLNQILELAEEAEELATEPDEPTDILANGREDEVVDLRGDIPIRRTI